MRELSLNGIGGVGNPAGGSTLVSPLNPLEWSGYYDADPDSHLTLAVAAIDAYLDQSGNSRTVSYVSGSKNSRDTTNTLDGYNTASCGGYGEYRGSAASSHFAVGGGTIIVVCKITDVAAARTVFNLRTSGNLELQVLDNSGTKFRFTLKDSGGTKNIDVAASTGAWQVLTARWNGSNIYARCNNTDATPVAAGNVTSLADAIELMGSSGSAQFGKGNGALFLTKASYLSDAALTTALAQIKLKHPGCGL